MNDKHFDERVLAAEQLVLDGDVSGASTIFRHLREVTDDPVRRANLINGEAVAVASGGDTVQAYRMLLEAGALDSTNPHVTRNLETIQDVASGDTSVRVAVLSLLFNWPSTGGGTIHTAETIRFLAQAGFEVRHFVARYAPWNVGTVSGGTRDECEVLSFRDDEWNLMSIQRRFRQAVDKFQPDYCIITDSWNFKPHLADAVSHYPYFIRLAAQECVCPLNNVRLLNDEAGKFVSCQNHQFLSDEQCRSCVTKNSSLSGALHHNDRMLSGFGDERYSEILRRAFQNAQGILAVNPIIAELVEPYCRTVHVVPSGFDPSRFEFTETDDRWTAESPRPFRVFFAGLIQEPMKGFRVLEDALLHLRGKGRRIECHATGGPAGPQTETVTFTGWLSQDELPGHIRKADVLAFPTVAEEALGRSAVEAMACSRPVVASRIGGLQWTVVENETGLLFEPGNSMDLARKLEVLMDSPELLESMGHAGRKRFESHFTWETVINDFYRPELTIPVRAQP